MIVLRSWCYNKIIDPSLQIYHLFSDFVAYLLIMHLFCKDNVAVDCCQTFTGKHFLARHKK